MRSENCQCRSVADTAPDTHQAPATTGRTDASRGKATCVNALQA